MSQWPGALHSTPAFVWKKPLLVSIFIREKFLQCDQTKFFEWKASSMMDLKPGHVRQVLTTAIV